ncbi:hypothetical protein E5D57_010318 [Metarhizium anisopliae]|nr:hypothetical protein E5D57_010318 [Metarhizium anisopliae]
MYGGGVERLAVWGSEGRRETPDSTWSPGEGGVAEDAHPTRQRQALRVCESATHRADRLESVDGRRPIDSTAAREVREVRMREDPVGTSARPLAADRGHTHTVLALRCRLIMVPVASVDFDLHHWPPGVRWPVAWSPCLDALHVWSVAHADPSRRTRAVD